MQVDVPTLLIVGENDRVIPPIATKRYLKRYIKDITINTAISAHHNPFKETPEQYQEFITAFLKSLLDKSVI
jgi:pimeloyl-ACP methyl ester carboxylesterase